MMNKKIFIIMILLFLPLVSADKFIHEGDHNYSVSNVAMTTHPRLNHFLILDFNLSIETGTIAKNKHVHLKIFDDRNALIQDYSFQYTKEGLPINTHPSITNSKGHKFYRILPSQNITENRFVSDDSGKVSVQLHLNPCQLNQVTECFIQNSTYRIEIIQESLNHSEYFTVMVEKIEDVAIVQDLTYIGNNADVLIYYLLYIFVGVIIISAIGLFVIRRFRK